MTKSLTKSRIAIALAVLAAAALFAHPAGAQSTADKLKEAKKTLAEADRAAASATAEYEAARERHILTEERIVETKQRMKKAERRIERYREKLSVRAREAYRLGVSSTLELLLAAESFTEFSDRMVFLDQLAQEDADLVVRVSVLSEELARQREDLALLGERQKETVKLLDEKRDQVYKKLAQAAALRKKLEKQLKAEQAVVRAMGSGSTGVVQGQALQACPAPGTSFVDSWGAPRSGGRSHQGVDMMGPQGLPVYAAQSGTVRHSTSSLGGISAYVSGKDTTFYAHLKGYSGVKNGQSVSAGTLIGYLGDTGNARGTPHLHFEYHPGGGGAVNPYPYVRAVC